MSRTQYSHSRVSTYQQCPAQYKYRYIDGLKTVHNPAPDDALIVGNALHIGIEKDQKAMLDWYYNQFYIIDDQHVNEAIKLTALLPKVKQFLSTLDGPFRHEYEINRPDFKGFVDLIVSNPDGSVDVFDFKYSNNVDKYLESAQPHLYKFYLEREPKHRFKVRRIGFVFIPKVNIRQRKDETLYQFRRRLIETLAGLDVDVRYVPYDFAKVKQFWKSCSEIEAATDFPKNPSRLCDWCEFKTYCLEGLDYMILPKNERRQVTVNTTPDMWLYGDSYSGKTVFADQFDDNLMINTDGNVDHISSPVLRIKDEVIVEGRITKRKFAWQVFEEVVTELEKKQNDFKIVTLDLIEDLYEHCRLYMYDQMGIEHEQDAGYGKGWDMVRTRFLSTIKRLKNAGYQLIYISKLSVSEINERGGKITRYMPNIPDKVANVLAGTVDLTARVIADGENRYLSFKTSPYIFGGSRYDFGVDQIPLDKDVFIETLKNAKVKTSSVTRGTEEEKSKRGRPRKEESSEEPTASEIANEPPLVPPTDADVPPEDDTPPWEDVQTAQSNQPSDSQQQNQPNEQPTRTRRQRRA